MFRHKDNPSEGNPKPQETQGGAASQPIIQPAVSSAPTEANLKDLIEKNLKWSQIIYEQNRKLNSKLFWIAAAGWMKLLIIILPLIAAVIFLPPILKDVWGQYGDLLGLGGSANLNSDQAGQQAKSLENVLKLLNLDPAQQERLKALLK